MRSPADDLTLRSRIRDGAIRLFGRRGFAATTVRAIAEEAGSSPALVLHHFGSKEGLREACDEHVVGMLMARNTAALDEASAEPGGATSLMREWLADVDRFRGELDYLARMLLDGSPAGERLFGELVGETRAMIERGAETGAFTRFSDPHVVAVILAAQSMVPLLFERPIARELGRERLDGDVIRSMTLPSLELYTHGLYADSSMLDAARAALGRGTPPPSGKGPGDPVQDPDPPRAGAPLPTDPDERTPGP